MKKIIFLFVVIIVAIIVAAIITASQGQFGIFIAISILFPIVILAFIFSMIRKGKQNKDNLLKTGEPAKAKILSVSDTGVTVNNRPRIAIHLEVTPQKGSPFEVKIHALISLLQPLQYQAGMMLQVRYDPKNINNVAIESFDKNSSNTQNAQNNIEIKPLLCPSCGGQIKMDNSMIREKMITCNYCGTVIDLHV